MRQTHTIQHLCKNQYTLAHAKNRGGDSCSSATLFTLQKINIYAICKVSCKYWHTKIVPQPYHFQAASPDLTSSAVGVARLLTAKA